MHVPSPHKPQRPRDGAEGGCDPLLLGGDRRPRIIAQLDRNKQAHVKRTYSIMRRSMLSAACAAWYLT